MATLPTDPRAEPAASPLASERRVARGRSLALATAVVFVVSSAFPVVAGLSKNTAAFPPWWGPPDVGIAFLLALLALVVMTIAQGRVGRQADEASYRAYRILTHGILVVLVVFFLGGDRIIWPNCLTGFAWRAWLLLYSLPAWFTMWGSSSKPRPAARG
jgi:hypothetical protein